MPTVQQHPNFRIHKVGGASLGRIENLCRLVDIIKNEISTALTPIIVVSALSGNGKKIHGTTSKLLDMADAAITGKASIVKEELDSLRQFHQSIAKSSLSQDTLCSFTDYSNRLFRKLEHFLEAAITIQEVSPRSLDIIVSFGERLSALFITFFLIDKNIKAEYIDLMEALPKNHEAEGYHYYLDESFYDSSGLFFADKIRSKLIGDDSIGIVTGFFGPVPGSLLKSIGRGYTDLTAVLLAKGFGLCELIIWKEVAGIYSADPFRVNEAFPLPIITTEEATELTHYGAEVVNSLAMKQITQSDITLYIKDIGNPKRPGTIVQSNSSLSHLNHFKDKPTATATAVTIKEGILVVTINPRFNQPSQTFLAKTFALLEQHSIIVDLISTSRVDLCMAIPAIVKDERTKLLVKDLSNIGNVTLRDNLTIISLIGKGMRNRIGMSAKMFNVLANAGINIEMISQGASEINISCVVSASKAPLALTAIHNSIILDNHKNN